MPVTLPYPDKPANGQSPDATPILANLVALLNAINSFDGAGIIAKSVTEQALADQVNPRMRDAGWMHDFIESGGYTSFSTGLTWTMPSGMCWGNGYRNLFAGASYSVAINTDTYYSVDYNGNVNAPLVVATNAPQPALPANSQWLAKAIAGPSAITSIVDLRTLSPLGGTLVPFTPVVGGLTPGANSTILTNYAVNGKVVTYWGRITLGAGFSWAGGLTVTLPVPMLAAMATAESIVQGAVTLLHSGVSVLIGHAIHNGPSSVGFRAAATNSGANPVFMRADSSYAVSGTTPFTWVAGDVIEWSLTYMVQ